MQTEMSKWGNSAAFRVPAALVQASGITIGTKMDIEVSEGRLILTPRKQKMSRAERYARIIASAEAIGSDEEIDWGPDVGNEIVD